MRTPTYMILLAAPLALAACDAADDSSETMMSDDMANSDSMPMSGEMPMAEETGGLADGPDPEVAAATGTVGGPSVALGRSRRKSSGRTDFGGVDARGSDEESSGSIASTGFSPSDAMDMDENAGGAGATPRQNPAELLDQLVQMTTLADGVSWVGAPFQEMYPQLWDDYRKRIAMPMDLRTVRENLQAGIYLPKAGEKVPPDFVRDVRRIWTRIAKITCIAQRLRNARATKSLLWSSREGGLAVCEAS